MLYGIAFTFSACCGLSSILLPFAAMRLGAGPSLVGLVGGCYMGGYMLCCLLAVPHIDRVRPKPLILACNVGYVLLSLLMAFTHRPHVLAALALVYGVLMAGVWPPLMSWVSHGFEGVPLNRRLGRYNICWGSGLIISPYVGGRLIDVDVRLAFGALAAAHGLALACAALARTRQPRPVRHDQDDCREPPSPQPAGDTLRFMARVSLMGAYVALGLARFQFPVLAKSLGIESSDFGVAIAALSLANVLAFALLGRTALWHYRPRLLWASQFLLAANVAVVCFARTTIHLCVLAAGIGALVSLAYSSSLFYGVSGQRNRGRMTTIHELVLSTGFVIGSIGSGYFTEWIGLKATYPVFGAVLLAGVILQVIAYRLSGIRAPAAERNVPSA